MGQGGNGSARSMQVCEACDIPGRVGRLELGRLHSERDQAALLAEVRALRVDMLDHFQRVTDELVRLYAAITEGRT